METLLNAIPDAYVLMEETGIVREVNPALTQLLGYEAKEVVGRNVSMLMPEEIAINHDGFLHRYVEIGDPRILGRIRQVEAKHKDGKTLPVSLSVTELVISDQHWFVGLLRQVMEG
jgi:two-component system sensor kinase FixL